MKSWAIFFLAYLLLLLLAVQDSHAEFLRAGNIYGDDNNVIIPTKRGILVASNTAVPFQNLDPTKLPNKVPSVFVEFSATSYAFSKLYVGKTSYAIRGPLTLQVGELKISLAHNVYPYLTVSSTNPARPSILGLAGSAPESVLFNASGAVLTVLEAGMQDLAPSATNQQNLIMEYVVKDRLYLNQGNGRLSEVTVNWVGVALDSQTKNPCAEKDNVVILNNKDSARVRGAKTLAEKQRFFKQIRKQYPANPLDSYLPLVFSKKHLIVLDFSTNSLNLVRIIPDLSEALHSTVCVTDSLNLYDENKKN